MANSTQIDLVSFATATTGTGSITPGSAVTGYRGASALTSGATYSYAIKDGANWEGGQGVWNGTVLTRVVTESSNSNTAISLSGTATVVITALAADFRNFGRNVLLGKLLSANFNTTADQTIALTQPGTGPWVITQIMVVNASTSLTTAKGTFYAGATKTNQIIPSAAITSTFTALAASTDVVVAQPTLMAQGGFLSGQNPEFHFAYFGSGTASTNIFLSLTTAQGGAATADIYVFGYDLT